MSVRPWTETIPEAKHVLSAAGYAQVIEHVEAERDQYRQAALELQAEIRHALAWAATGAERSVADAMLLKTAEKWRSLLDED